MNSGKISDIAEKDFAALTSEQIDKSAFDDSMDGPRSKFPGTKKLRGSVSIPLHLIDSDPDQPRKEFDDEEIAEMASTVEDYGIINPISVRLDSQTGRYIVLSGERRWRSAQKAGLAEMPCIVCDISKASVRLVHQLIENIHRKDLSPMEKARGLYELKEKLDNDAGHKVEWGEVEKVMGMTERRRRQFTSLLDLPEEIQKEIVALGYHHSKNQITEGHARALHRLREDPAKQFELFKQIKESPTSISSEEAMKVARGMLGLEQVEKKQRVVIHYESKSDLIAQLKKMLKELEGK